MARAILHQQIGRDDAIVRNVRACWPSCGPSRQKTILQGHGGVGSAGKANGNVWGILNGSLQFYPFRRNLSVDLKQLLPASRPFWRTNFRSASVDDCQHTPFVSASCAGIERHVHCCCGPLCRRAFTARVPLEGSNAEVSTDRDGSSNSAISGARIRRRRASRLSISLDSLSAAVVCCCSQSGAMSWDEAAGLALLIG